MRDTRKIILREDYSRSAVEALNETAMILTEQIQELNDLGERDIYQESELQKLYRLNSVLASLSYVIEKHPKEPFPFSNRTEEDDNSRRKENFIAP
tara:strand:+ start:448 stop:735 length:288 start_codon:yes stop_codon:yes gene_type:complete